MGIDEYSILKKKPKKNAFAATALLISIAIALLVMVGAVLVLSKVNDKDRITPSDNGSEKSDGSNDSTTCEGLVKEIVFNDNLTTIKDAAISYFTNERLPQSVGETKKITLKEMIDKKLVRTVRDASANACDGTDSYVEVTKDEDEYVMKIFLSCSDLEDYIIVHLGCYDYCDRDVCEKKEETPKTYEYEYKKTTSCTMSPWSSWGEWKTTREKTSNLKKEDIKKVSSSKDGVITIDATANTSYSCDKYSGYIRVGTKCIKEIVTPVTKDAVPSKYVYTCDKYPGYSVSGSKCIKEISNTDTKTATATCPSGYTQSGTKCNKTIPTTITVDAEAVYSTRNKTVYYACYKQECTTKTIFSCPTSTTCGDHEETTCENVRHTCTKTARESYISSYKCADSSYTLGVNSNGNHICTKASSTVDTKNVTYVCPSGYTQSGTTCTKVTKTIDAKEASQVPSDYVCPSGYTKEGLKCTKIVTDKDTKDAEKKVTYSCPVGYTRKDKSCSKTTKETITQTFYRYATRTCTGGSTSIKWSTSKKDTTLINAGYRLTGNKRVVKEIIK